MKTLEITSQLRVRYVADLLQLPVLEMLLEHGASLHAKTRNGDTAFGKTTFVLRFHVIIGCNFDQSDLKQTCASIVKRIRNVEMKRQKELKYETGHARVAGETILQAMDSKKLHQL